MTRTTFTHWLFSWLSNFKDDFRKTCPICKFSPRVLACDGTKLGLYLKNAFNISPIEEPVEGSGKVMYDIRRNDRCFFYYPRDKNTTTKQMKDTQAEIRQAREDLAYFCKVNTGGDMRKEDGDHDETKKKKKEEGNKKPKEDTDKARSDEERVQNILKHCPAECREIMNSFCKGEYHQDLLQKLSPVFQVLSTYRALTSLISWRFLDIVEEWSDACLKNCTLKKSRTISTNMPEIYKAMMTATKHGAVNVVAELYKNLVKLIREIHSEDPQPQEPSEQGEYNPEKQGRAYYFTSSGKPVRSMPSYSANKDTEEKSDCHKRYPTVQRFGTTYMFLWFDPQHYGHCYGFHVIPSSEGRKDVHSSLYMYLDKCPNELFYDNACQTEEYCLNREPQFWLNCRFFHDIFHGFSHKCPYVYMSQRITSLARINTSICEQFNAYIQKVKHTARGMSQSHFMFYVQYFVDKWNRDRLAKFKSKARVARKFL